MSVLDSPPNKNTYVDVPDFARLVGPGHVICAEHGPLSPAPEAGTFDIPESASHSADAGEARAVSPQRKKEAAPAAKTAEQVRPAAAYPAAVQPTANERASHEMTHTPFAEWCWACVAGRGRDTGHSKVKADGPPVVELEYSFMRTGAKGDSLVTILLGMRKVLGYVFAAWVTSKGLEDRAAVSTLAQWLLEASLMGDTRLHSDGEASIRTVALEVAARRAPAQTSVEVTPRGSSSSFGAAERFAEMLAGLIRTFRRALEKLWGVTIAAVDPFFPFLAQFAAFVYNRCHVRNVGTTPFEQVQHRACTSRLQPFGTNT